MASSTATRTRLNGEDSVPSDNNKLRAARLLLVLFISRSISVSGVDVWLDQSGCALDASLRCQRSVSTTWPLSLPPASSHKPATMRGTAGKSGGGAVMAGNASVGMTSTAGTIFNDAGARTAAKSRLSQPESH